MSRLVFSCFCSVLTLPLVEWQSGSAVWTPGGNRYVKINLMFSRCDLGFVYVSTIWILQMKLWNDSERVVASAFVAQYNGKRILAAWHENSLSGAAHEYVLEM
jgi:hypothetical protein